MPQLPTPRFRMTRLRADLLLLFAAAVWGLAFVFQKTAMASLGPLTFIAARGGIAAAVLLPLAYIEYRRLPINSATARVAKWPPGLLHAGCIAGVAFFIGAVLQQSGLQSATATNAGFLTALYVVLTPPLAFLMHGTQPSAVIIPAVLMSAVGTWMLGGGAFAALSTGDWLIAASAIGWAMHVILSERGATFDRPILVHWPSVRCRRTPGGPRCRCPGAHIFSRT